MRVFKIVTDFENAVKLYVNRGGGHPADIPAIEENYSECKTTLVTWIERNSEALTDCQDELSRLKYPDMTGK